MVATEQKTDAEKYGNTVDMPFQGEMVLWHRTGRREADPKVVLAVKHGRQNMVYVNTLDPIHGSVYMKRGIPHITDPRLANTEYAKNIGCWELTEFGVEMRTFGRRLAACESACGVVAPKRTTRQ